MYTPLQLNIIREFGSKELSFGCLIFRKEKQNIHQMDSHDLPCDEGEIWREQGNAEPYLLTKDFEILGHIPHLFPDVSRVAKENGYSIEVVKGDMFTSLIKISRWDIVNPTIIEFKDTIPLLEQSESTLTQLLTLFKNEKNN